MQILLARPAVEDFDWWAARISTGGRRRGFYGRCRTGAVYVADRILQKKADRLTNGRSLSDLAYVSFPITDCHLISLGGECAAAKVEVEDDRVNNVTKTYGGRIKAVDNITFTVEPGCIYGFLGPNSLGKTTTIKLIAGIIRPDSGAIRVCGRYCARALAAKKASAVPDDPNAFLHLKAWNT